MVQTYGNEELENRNYQKYLKRSEEASNAAAIKGGLGIALMMGCIYLFYSYTMYFGGYLVWTAYEDQVESDYTGGAVIAIMFMVIIGAFMLGGSGE